MMTTQPSDSEKPANGQQVITACAFIHHEFDGVPKVLLPKRADHKKFLAGMHELPGGHIDFGEDIVDGLKREIREELQKDVIVGEPFAVFTYTNEIKGSHSIQVVYFAQLIGNIGDIVLDPHSHSALAWFAQDEIDQIATQTGREPDDLEVAVVKRGFELLAGDRLKV